jgi:hypothetical protein
MSLRETINGAKAIILGFGENPPSRSIAQSRANVCLHSGKDGTPCPHNHSGSWSATTEIAKVIQSEREKKLQLNLHVDEEEGLGVCKICKCPMFLKVFYDWDTIFRHTTDSQFEAFRSKWPKCWILKELDQHLKTKP